MNIIQYYFHVIKKKSKEMLKQSKLQDFENTKIYIFTLKFYIRNIKNLNVKVDE